MRFDHLLHWVPDREAAVAAYRQAGFHVTIGGEHPWGTHNALVHFGLPYIEIIAFYDRGRARQGPVSVLAHADHLLPRGGGSRNFAVAVPDLAAAAAALGARGVPVGDPEPGRRVRPDGTVISWQKASILSGPAWRPFLIEWGQADGERLADLQARGIDRPHPLGLLRTCELHIATLDPAADAAWAEQAFGLPARREGAAWRLPLPGCDLVLAGGTEAGLAAGELPRVTGLVLAGAQQPARLDILGLTLVLRTGA